MELKVKTDYKDDASFNRFCLQSLSPLLSPTMSPLNLEPTKKSCHCRRSKCLKLYCECFASNQYCIDCVCSGCCNKPSKNIKRQSAITKLLTRNPEAFMEHSIRCNCSKSSCIKKYCACYNEKQPCSEECACFNCSNPYI